MANDKVFFNGVIIHSAREQRVVAEASRKIYTCVIAGWVEMLGFEEGSAASASDPTKSQPKLGICIQDLHHGKTSRLLSLFDLGDQRGTSVRLTLPDEPPKSTRSLVTVAHVYNGSKVSVRL